MNPNCKNEEHTHTFRDFEKRLCILEEPLSIRRIDRNHTSGANAVLCYGYVDHTAGLTFEALALLSCVENDYTIVLEYSDIGLKIRADENKMKNARPIHNKALLLKYAKRIEALDIYYSNADVIKTRRMKVLDPLRHPQYPDDIPVFFIWKDNGYERMWVRCEKHKSTDSNGFRFFSGELLNEPNRDCGFHIGKQVTFALSKADGQSICIASGDEPD